MTMRLVQAALAPVWRGPAGSTRDDRVTETLAGEPVRTTGARSDGRVAVYPGWVEEADLGVEVGAEPALAVDPGVLAQDSDDPVDLARHLLGTPYVWGGLSGQGIDCSGLVHLVHRAVGRVVPRDARDQAAALSAVAPDDVRRGDLYFFARPGEPVHHVGLVVEPGVMLHASDLDGGVVEGRLDAGRSETLVSAGRVVVDLR
jgi:gamma-D-glutamyl-L-lysine dipeptidyl-peptidase